MGRCCFYTVGTLSLLLLVTSVTLLVARVFQKAVEQTIQKNIVLKNGTETFDYWETPPLPVYTQFYFFNVTNPEEILKGETPHVTEVGPYTYRSLDWWGTESCNMINGTDGDSFHPLITKDEILYVFPSDFCRSVYITFSGFENIQGLPALKYKLPAEILANTSENAGFCLPEGNCLGSGVLNVSICKNGAPIILSAPHFYQADEKFLSAIAGMHPNKDHHETFVDINPLTGIILRAAKRFQINVYVRKLDEFVETGNIQTLVFPVMYLNESVLIDKETADRLKAALNTTVIVTNIPYIIMALGVFFGLIFIGLVCRGQGSMDEGTPDERAPLIRT
ncbi:PREDICTED: lysosome membrane protein 2 isoform X2 [Chrysochloris asiatica]|uniref:Lysosome membrane protein 2 isoform X2 n=1 Tax=Chrysochloris asiatica TaxID=185453 RepID=A0A9B0TVM9_CHRAS|nr:PREDICTED: lysosome membrane protein 2 isoform X2 [Chrysochloris asiatica]